MHNHCDDSILQCSTMMSPSTATFPTEHMKTKQNRTKTLFFRSLMVNWAKHKTTDLLQVRVKPLWGRKEQTYPLFLPQQKEGTVMKSAGKFNMFPNRTPQKNEKAKQNKLTKNKKQLRGKYKETNLSWTMYSFCLPTLSSYQTSGENYFRSNKALIKYFSLTFQVPYPHLTK